MIRWYTQLSLAGHLTSLPELPDFSIQPAPLTAALSFEWKSWKCAKRTSRTHIWSRHLLRQLQLQDVGVACTLEGFCKILETQTGSVSELWSLFPEKDLAGCSRRHPRESKWSPCGPRVKWRNQLLHHAPEAWGNASHQFLLQCWNDAQANSFFQNCKCKREPYSTSPPRMCIHMAADSCQSNLDCTYTPRAVYQYEQINHRKSPQIHLFWSSNFASLSGGIRSCHPLLDRTLRLWA